MRVLVLVVLVFDESERRLLGFVMPVVLTKDRAVWRAETAHPANLANVDLAGTLGGATGDGQPDRVVVNGTNGDDTINVNGDAGGVKVSGLAATIGILHPEAANDRLEINTLAGRDTVDFGGLAAGVIQLFVDGALVP